MMVQLVPKGTGLCKQLKLLLDVAGNTDFLFTYQVCSMGVSFFFFFWNTG